MAVCHSANIEYDMRNILPLTVYCVSNGEKKHNASIIQIILTTDLLYRGHLKISLYWGTFPCLSHDFIAAIPLEITEKSYAKEH